MINPEQEKINAIERSAIDSVVHYFVAIRRGIREETGDDLLEKSPETLGRLANAASNVSSAGYVGLRLEEISSAIDSIANGSMIRSEDVALFCDQLHKSSGDVLESGTRIAKEIEQLAKDLKNGDR